VTSSLLFVDLLHDLGMFYPLLAEEHVDQAMNVTAGRPRPDDRMDPLAHPPPRIGTILGLHGLLAERPDALIVVVGLRVALALGRDGARATEGLDQAVGVDLQRAIRVIIGGLPHRHHRVELLALVEDPEREIDDLAVDVHGVAEQEDDVLEVFDAGIDVLDGVLDHDAMVDRVPAELVRPRDDLRAGRARRFGDGVTVGRHPDLADPLGGLRGLDRVVDHRLSHHGQDVLVDDGLGAGTGGDDGNVHGNSAL
jgi:hypothetical protein